MDQSAVRPDTLRRKPWVLSHVPVGNSKLYAMIAAGEFPAPVKIGPNSVAWRESDVFEWIKSRPVADLRRASTNGRKAG